MKIQKKLRIKEFGDFQTPLDLAFHIVDFLRIIGIKPSTILEPTCGTGSFLFAVIKTFPNAHIVGMDINKEYVSSVKEKLVQINKKNNIDIKEADFFQVEWKKEITSLKKPILIIGNPPWITSAEMTVLNGNNLPDKFNIHKYRGLEAKTGKSNFDISEWVIITLLKALSGYDGVLAMLCKTSVARKALMYCHDNQLTLKRASMHLIDTKEYFKVSVDACLFICHLKPNIRSYSCQIYHSLGLGNLIQKIGVVNGEIIANLNTYQKWSHLQGESQYIWRSGIKHDCARVMELTKKGELFLNGFNEQVLIEEDYLYPMLKSSDVANNRVDNIKKWMIVPQKCIGEETSIIKTKAPLTWEYLLKNAKKLDARASSIYKNRPRFSIFGVGEYSFSPWKIAISGLYKKIHFRLIQTFSGKPVVFDDTCYFISINSFEEAILLYSLLNHSISLEFYESFIHWDAKRPITKQILQSLDLKKIYKEIGREKTLELVQNQVHESNIEIIEQMLEKLKN
ncbi:MAG: methyltransferase domain-containing protein [Candidatus Hodarchaeota archaeon]